MWDDMGVIFLRERLPEAVKNRKTKIEKAFSHGRTIQRDIKSDRPDPVPGSFRRTHSMMQKRGDP